MMIFYRANSYSLISLLFPQNDPQNKPRATWRSHGNLLFANWLNYYVYQITPYDLRHMNPTLE